jgi:hypothetical protein
LRKILRALTDKAVSTLMDATMNFTAGLKVALAGYQNAHINIAISFVGY